MLFLYYTVLFYIHGVASGIWSVLSSIYSLSVYLTHRLVSFVLRRGLG